MARRLDHFLIKVPLLQHFSRYRQWVGSGGISDHSPIYLEILGLDAKPKAPFKFNHVWLQDEGYIKLVKDYWTSHPISGHRSAVEGLCHNLSQLKHLSIERAKEKKAKDDQTIITIEAELNNLLDDRNKGFASTEEKVKMIKLEKQRDKILMEREETWRLKSREIWLQVGITSIFLLFEHPFAANGFPSSQQLHQIPSLIFLQRCHFINHGLFPEFSIL